MQYQKTDDKFGWSDLIKALLFLLGDKKKPYLFWEGIIYLIHFYEIIPPLLIGKIVDFFVSYQKGQSLTPFYIYTGVFGISFCVVALIRLSLRSVLGDLRSEVTYQIKVSGFEKLMDFSLRWHDRELTGNKVQRIQNGVNAFYELDLIFQNEIVRSFTTFFGIVIVFIFLKPSYIIFFASFLTGFFIILHYFYSRIQKLNNEYFSVREKAGGTFVEGLSNILTIKTLGATQGFKSQIARKEEITKRYEYQIRHFHVRLWKTYQVFSGISLGLFLLLVGQDVIAGAITIGSIVVFYRYLQNLLSTTNDFTLIYERLIQAKSAIGRMMVFFWSKATAQEGSNLFPDNWKRINLHKVSFNYKAKNDQKSIGDNNLTDIDLTIRKSEKIGLVGKTGSGKSTLAKLLVGLYKFEKGEYKIDNLNFYDIRHAEVLKNMALVLQDSEMFNLSLKENITLLRKLDEELLQKAIAISQLTEVVAKLPEGLDTLLGEKGYHLSGGERQRVGIARAIYKDPEIIILDESSSSLDHKTEQALQKALETNLTNKTLIIIAHRISTLKNVDKIYVFAAGKIVEKGTFTELITNPKSHFAKIYNLQNK